MCVCVWEQRGCGRQIHVGIAGCMAGLVRYLDSDAAEVASMAARAFWYLSNTPGNRPALMKQAGLYDKLVS